MAKEDSEHQKTSMSMLFRGKAIFKPLNTGWIDDHVACVREWILVPGHTWGHMVYLIDDHYLFTGDTIWFGADGGYSFLSTLAEDNGLAVRSLEKLVKIIRSRNHSIAVITGHTGWSDDLDFVFAHTDDICKPFAKRYTDPEAPYDSYIEDDDTEEKAWSVRLARKEARA